MNNFQQQITQQWRGSIINKLIITNVVLFLLFFLLSIFSGLFQFRVGKFLNEWLALSSNLETVLYHPWTLVTYGFLFHSFFHLLFSMLWVFWIGQMLVGFIGFRKLLPIYFTGILVGAFIFLLGTNLFPAFRSNNYFAYGGSAGYMALLWATVTLFPKQNIRLIFIGSIPLLYLAIGITALDLLTILSNSSNLSNIGGALGGFIFVKLYQSGYDLSSPFNQIFDSLATIFTKKPSPRYTRPNTNNRKPKTKGNEAEMNAILDKINKYGYESLSRKEKEFMFRQSKKS